MYDWIRRVLSRPRADLVVIAIGTVLSLPSVPTGVAADDFIHELAVSGSRAIPGFARAPWDLFRFASGDYTRMLMEDGVLPWWTNQSIRFAFFRPLTSLTHLFDHVVFHDAGVFLHLHTIAWATCLLFALRALYRAVDGDGWGAVLALAMYTFDDARGPPIAWIANRNALVACSLSAWALYLYVRNRQNDRSAGVVAPLLFGLSLLAGEGAMAITPYLLAHALILQKGPLGKRLSSLASFGVVIVVWALVYRKLDYGIQGSGVYFDPLREPVQFLGALPERFAMLWFSVLGGPWSELWNGYATLFPGFEIIVAGVAVLALAGAAFLFAPVVRRDPVARFWIAGAVFATLPACGAFPADRLLSWVSIGAFGLIARFLQRFVEARSTAMPGRFPRVGAALAVAAHLVAGPLLYPFRVSGIVQVREALDRADHSVPFDASIRDKVVVLMNPPADPFASYIPVTREVLGVPRAKTQCWLSDGTTPVHVSRVDDRTLRIAPEGGFMLFTSERLFRNARTNPFHPGDHVTLNELEVTIQEVTSDGRPSVVLERLRRPLEDPSYVLLTWRGVGYVPFVPPPVGAEVVLPGTDLLSVVYGPDSFIARKLGHHD